MNRLKKRNLRGLADKGRHHLRSEDDQADSNADLQKPLHRFAHLAAGEGECCAERDDGDHGNGVCDRASQRSDERIERSFPGKIASRFRCERYSRANQHGQGKEPGLLHPTASDAGVSECSFPSERMTPMSKDNCWNRNIKPKLDKIGLGWANFLVMRRTHATLMNNLGVSGKLVADQLGHSLDVNQNVYTQTPVENRLPAVNQLEKSLFLM